MFLTSSDEVVLFVGASVQLLVQTTAEHSLRQSRVRLGLIDPDCTLIVDGGNAEVHVGTRDRGPVTGVVAMAASTAVAMCQGSVDVRAALAAGAIVVEGDGGLLLHALAARGKREPIDVIAWASRAETLRGELVAAG